MCNFLVKHFPFINQFAITSKVARCRSIKYSILVSSHISSKSSWLKILSDRSRIFLKSNWNRCPATFITGQSLSSFKNIKSYLVKMTQSIILIHLRSFPMRNIWIRRFILLKRNWRICPRHRWWFIRPQRHWKILLVCFRSTSGPVRSGPFPA